MYELVHLHGPASGRTGNGGPVTFAGGGASLASRQVAAHGIRAVSTPRPPRIGAPGLSMMGPAQ